jgi:AraC family transcriptional regulator
MTTANLHPLTSRASCEVMAAMYSASIEDGVLDGIPGRIDILVPGHHGGFEAALVSAERLGTRADVQAPCVSVLPGRHRLVISCTRPSDMVTMSLDDSFVYSRCGSGARPDLRGRHAVSDPFLRRVGNALRSGFRVGRPPTAAYLESLAGAIADHLGAAYEPGSERGNGLAPHRLQRVRALIAQRLGEQIHVEDLAEAIYMSPFHFARMFKKATGEAPHEFITRQRMQEARRLLSETDDSLAAIAKKVGYKTQAHFTGVFHERVGTTPRAYRNAHPRNGSDLP